MATDQDGGEEVREQPRAGRLARRLWDGEWPCRDGHGWILGQR